MSDELHSTVTDEVFEPDELLKSFLSVYPEFSGIITNEEEQSKVMSIVKQLKCLYPEFENLDTCVNLYPFFMLLAHYIVYLGYSKSLGIYAQNGLVASSSIDGVSVSYQSSPYSRGDELTYFLGLTPYGMQYLAWLARRAGLRLVN